MKKQLILTSLAIVLGLFGRLELAQAQITILTPTGDLVVDDAADFATEVLNQPWDFSHTTNFPYLTGFSPSGVSVGKWGGGSSPVCDGNGCRHGSVWPHFGGLTGIPLAVGLGDDPELPANGRRTPIDASRYWVLSFSETSTTRDSNPTTPASVFKVSWESDASKEGVQPDMTSFYADFQDGFLISNPSPTYYSRPSGWNIYSFDLKTAALANGGTWDGQIHSLRIEPVNGYANNATVRFDWMRLVDISRSESYTLQFYTYYAPTTGVCTLYVDSDSLNYDGQPLEFMPCAVGGNYTFEFPTAILPPGDHYLYVGQASCPDSSCPTVYHSAYRRLLIKPKPTVRFVSPSEVSGREYSASDLGNAWDMAEPSDVLNMHDDPLRAEVHHFGFDVNNPAASFFDFGSLGTLLKSVSIPTAAITSDSTSAEILGAHYGSRELATSIWLPTDSYLPIDPNEYRYLNVRMNLGTDSMLMEDRLKQYWLSGIEYSNTAGLAEKGAMRGHVYFPGMHTYTFDLWNGSFTGRGRSWSERMRWLNLSLQLFHTSTTTPFELDWVKLNEQPRATDTFEIQLALSNLSFSPRIELYYSVDKIGTPQHLGTIIGSLSQTDYSYIWNVSSLGQGTFYWLKAAVFDDTVSTTAPVSYGIATVPVFVGNSVSSSPPKAPFDFDGDGQSEQYVMRPSSGLYYQNRQGGALPVVAQWVPGQEFHPIAADFDGDRKTDLAVVFNYYNSLAWYIAESSTGVLRGVVWGLPTDQIVPADYDGDGRDEIAVMRDGYWYILDETGVSEEKAWGQAGDVAVAADFDGDGRADPTVFRISSNGFASWWILFSDPNSGSYGYADWGLSGDIPVPGYWDGDSRCDFGVWRPSNGTWYLRNNSSTLDVATQWGLPGDVPIVGDFNGDSLSEFTVFRPSNGYWFHRYQNDQYRFVQFGLSGDRVGMNAVPITQRQP